MTDRIAAVDAYTSALMQPDEATIRAVASVLADNVIVQTNFGRAEGKEAAVALLNEPRTAGLIAAGAQWTRPTADGDRVAVTATLPDTAPFGGLEFAFEFSGDEIVLVEQQTLPAPPLTPRPLRLTADIKAAVNNALDNQTPMLIAYTDDTQRIHISFRGTIQAYSDDQLALWARDPAGGLPRHIADRPQVTLFYHDPSKRTSYTFYGRARLEHDPASRAAIYENSHPRERQTDFRQQGVAIVVDLDSVEGRDPGGRLLMVRAQP
ncbi:MAG: pyridoxamine 5'-phosphate oxidase family protein [Actinobacteria bacterium]|nr:pyridoxamine 5'-phosphate oxidase family protein [Actinomycetota bacterium]